MLNGIIANYKAALFLITVPVAIILNACNVHSAIIFSAELIAIVALSLALTLATEKLSLHFGPVTGAFLNVSCGNLAEIILL